MLRTSLLRSTAYSHRANCRRAYACAAMTVQHESARAMSGAEASSSGRTERPLLSIAPMMDWTDLHYRQLARMLSKRTWLWTEMVVDKTILHNPHTDKLLWFPPEQHPIVLQLGGSDPDTLAAATRIAAKYNYDEINLNCGCPSDRVAGAGCFGAALMLDPELVAACMAAMKDALGPDTPTSVKCRLGVDEADTYAQLAHFVKTVSEKGHVTHFIIHARKCLLKGLNPAQNRTIPPLRHEWVWALKRDFPHLQFTLNGGVLTALSAADAIQLAAHGIEQGAAIHGVMIGRAAYNDPWGVLADADVHLFGDAANPATSRRQVLQEYCTYADAMVGRWAVKEDGHRDPSLRALVKPLLNLFHGDKGNKAWKNAIDVELRTKKFSNFSELMAVVLPVVPEEVLDAPPKTAAVAALAAAENKVVVPFSIAEELPAADSRAAGGENLKRRRDENRKAAKQQQQQQRPEQQEAAQQQGVEASVSQQLPAEEQQRVEQAVTEAHLLPEQPAVVVAAAVNTGTVVQSGHFAPTRCKR